MSTQAKGRTWRRNTVLATNHESCRHLTYTHMLSKLCMLLLCVLRQISVGTLVLIYQSFREVVCKCLGRPKQTKKF